MVLYGDAAGTVPGRREDERPLLRFWTDYEDAERQRIVSTVGTLNYASVTCSDPMVNAIRWKSGTEQILHLLNYNYDAATDTVRHVRGLTVRLPWPSGRGATCKLLRPGHEELLTCTTGDGWLVVEIPELDCYGLMVLRESPSSVAGG